MAARPPPWERENQGLRKRLYSNEDRERMATLAKYETAAPARPAEPAPPKTALVDDVDLTSPDKPRDPVRERSEYTALVLTFSGYASFVVDRLTEHVASINRQVSPCDVVAALVHIHTCVTFEQLTAMMKAMFGVDRSRSYWHAHVELVADACSSRPLIANYRYAEADDDLFETATGALDGVPVFLKASDTHYNGKKKRKYISVQVLVDLEARPVWSGAPVEGRQHDSKAAEHAGATFPHKQDEIILADKAYVSNAHCLTQFKKPPSGHLTWGQKLFNKAQQHRRARVERFFSTLQHHRFMQGCQVLSENATKLWFVLWNAEIFKAAGDMPATIPALEDEVRKLKDEKQALEDALAKERRDRQRAVEETASLQERLDASETHRVALRANIEALRSGVDEGFARVHELKKARAEDRAEFSATQDAHRANFGVERARWEAMLHESHVNAQLSNDLAVTTQQRLAFVRQANTAAPPPSAAPPPPAAGNSQNATNRRPPPVLRNA